jgi:hypothetical protein
MTERKSSWTRTTSTSPTREKSGGRVIQGQVWSACRYRRRRDGGGNIKREVRTMSEKQRDKQRWSPRFRARTADG